MMSAVYICKSCHEKQTVTIAKIYKTHDDHLASRQLLQRMDMSIRPFECVKGEIVVPSPCENCKTNMPIGILVTTLPVFDDSGEAFDIKLTEFWYTEIVDILPNSDVSSTLELYQEEVESNATTGHMRDHYSQAVNIDLCLLVKTRMNNGFCYLGFDANSERIYRPLHRTIEGRCCWDTDFNVNMLYSFKALKFPNDGRPGLTPLPHSNEDLLVATKVSPKYTKVDNTDLFTRLARIGRGSVEEIFGGIQDYKFVEEGDNGPSVGIVRCHGSQIYAYMDKDEKTRVGLGSYDFPYTGLNTQNVFPQVNPHYPALVILGLARPWAGKADNPYIPRRCYILVLRILQHQE